MILGKESTGKPTPFGMEFNQLLCPFFRSETDTYDMSEIRRQELENKMKIKQCSGSLITNKHILTSAECVTKNSEYLRQDINIYKNFIVNNHPESEMSSLEFSHIPHCRTVNCALSYYIDVLSLKPVMKQVCLTLG